MIECRHIDFSYDSKTILQGIDLNIENGEFLCILGQSGCGKSTLLRLLAGLERPSAGEIRIDGEVVNKLPSFRRYQKIGRVYQNPAMGTCAQLTILENMALADNKGKPYNLRPGTDRRRVWASIRRGLKKLARLLDTTR